MTQSRKHLHPPSRREAAHVHVSIEIALPNGRLAPRSPENRRASSRDRLYRFYVTRPDGDETETLALVQAESDDAAMDAGFRAVGDERIQHISLEWGVGDYDLYVDPAFFTVEELTDADQIQNALADCSALNLKPPMLDALTRALLERR